MGTITVPWETWWANVAVLRAKSRPYMLGHADCPEQPWERHLPN
jgi:hypothetical protein